LWQALDKLLRPPRATFKISHCPNKSRAPRAPSGNHSSSLFYSSLSHAALARGDVHYYF
jgi:hypothetical protein